MKVRDALQHSIRPSTTQSLAALWVKSLLNAVLFFAIFMIAMPALAHHLLPTTLPLPRVAQTWLAGTFALVGITAWMGCLDSFSRRGRGTPLPADAPSQLVTTGLFRQIRNPIMAAELLVIWAVALYLASVGAIIYAIAISIGAHLAVVHVEEPELRKRFGESYEAYLRSVPRWLPRVRHQK